MYGEKRRPRKKCGVLRISLGRRLSLFVNLCTSRVGPVTGLEGFARREEHRREPRMDPPVHSPDVLMTRRYAQRRLVPTLPFTERHPRSGAVHSTMLCGAHSFTPRTPRRPHEVTSSMFRPGPAALVAARRFRPG